MKDHSPSFRMRVNENGRDPHVGFRVARIRPNTNSDSSGRSQSVTITETRNEPEMDQHDDSTTAINQVADDSY